MGDWRLSGTYFEACSCDAICPCRRQGGRKPTTTGSTYGNCDFALSWRILDGERGAVSLSGLSVVMVGSYFDNEIGKPWRVCLYIDEAATEAQHLALTAIFLGRAGGTSLRNYAARIGEVYAVKRARIWPRTRASPLVHSVPTTTWSYAVGSRCRPTSPCRAAYRGTTIRVMSCKPRSCGLMTMRFVGRFVGAAALRRTSTIDQTVDVPLKSSSWNPVIETRHNQHEFLAENCCCPICRFNSIERLAARNKRPSPVPKDSVRVSIPGCTKGYVFTASPPNAEQPASVNIPDGMHMRMNGPKKVIAEIKAHEGSMIEITGLMKKGQFNDGVNIGGVRISPGSASPGGSGQPDHGSDSDRCRELASGRGFLSIALESLGSHNRSATRP